MIIGSVKKSMNKILLFLISYCLVACTLTPIPPPSKQMAIVRVSAQVSQTLMAETLDKKSVNDGRYFEVPAGEHRLTVLFQYNASETGGLFIGNNNTISCLISFYGIFTADTIYYLRAIPAINGANIFLNKEGTKKENVPINNVLVNCGPY